MTITTKEAATASATLPSPGFIRINTVLAHIPIGRSSWWAGVKSGAYPPAYKLGPATTVWKTEDILALIQKIGGAECPPSDKNAGAAASVQPHATTQRRAKKGGAA